MRELPRQGENEPWNMRHTSFDHPPVDVLERFALHNCSNEEIELIETHMLACESCVMTLENLDHEIAAFKVALEPYQAKQEQVVRAAEPSWKSWFSLPRLSLAGAALAACAVCSVALIPVKVDVKAERGIENVVVVPEWRSTQLMLDSESVPAGSLKTEIVDQAGSVVWSGAADSAQGRVVVHGLRMTHQGRYFARIYTADASHDLLAEFPLEVKLQF